MSEHNEDLIANLLDRWANQDYVVSHDDLVDMECPVDGNFTPLSVSERVEVSKAWDNIKSITMPAPVSRPKREYFDGGRVGVGQAIREERLGTPIGAFEEFYTGESDTHLEAVIEALGAPSHMTFEDAVNEANVY